MCSMKSMGSGWENSKIQLALKGLNNDKIPGPVVQKPIRANPEFNPCSCFQLYRDGFKQ